MIALTPLLLMLACDGDTGTQTTLPDDSATDSTPPGAVLPEPTVDASLVLGEVKTCADPSLRDDAPMTEVLTTEWLDQTVIGDGTPPSQETPRPGVGLAVADFTGDGHLDIFLPNNRGPDQLYVGDGDGGFTDQTSARWPASEVSETTSAAGLDVEGDGDVDIYLTVSEAPDRLFLNDGNGTFTDNGVVAGLQLNSVNSTWADVDGDGDLDGYVSAHFGKQLMEEPVPWLPPFYPDSNIYLENQGDTTFRDATSELPSDTHDGYTTLSGFHDVDGDGWMDLYVVNDYGTYRSNILLKNNEGVLSDVSAETGANIPILGMGLATADLNGDGDLEIFISSWGELVLLESVGDGTWYQGQHPRGLVPTGDSVVAWGIELKDLDNDGDLDAMVAYGSNLLSSTGLEDRYDPDLQPDQLFLQDDDGLFADAAPAWGIDDDGVGRGFVLADFDGNGWLDVVKRDLAGHAQLFLAACGTEAWLQVDLGGNGTNTHAVGARVMVVDGDRRWFQDMTISGTSMGSSTPSETHFGLGDSDEVAVVVTWPDGEISVTEGVQTRQRIRLERGSTER